MLKVEDNELCDMNDLRILNLKTMQDLGYGSREEIMSKVEQGVFPEPLDAGHGEPVWSARDVEAWLLTRPALLAGSRS